MAKKHSQEIDLLTLSQLSIYQNDFYTFKPPDRKYPSLKECEMLGTVYMHDGSWFQFSIRGGLYYSKEDVEDAEFVCSHIPYIRLRKYENTLTCERKSTIVMGIHNTDLEYLQCRMSDIDRRIFLSDYLPHNVIVKNPNRFREFLQLQTEFAPVVNIYKFTGFVPNEYMYVHSGGYIASKDNGYIRSELQGDNTRTLDDCGASTKDTTDFIRDLFHSIPLSTLLLSYNLLSLTYSKYDMKKPAFILVVFGESGTFKSTIDRFIFGIFREFYDVPQVNLKASSLPTVHNLMSTFRDCVVLFDDAAPSKNGNEDVYLISESIARAYGDSTGRSVMENVKNIHNTKPQCLGAITAEFQPLRDCSDAARSVMYELEPGDIQPKKLSDISERKPIYIKIITDYIYWICSKGDSYMTELINFFEKGREMYYPYRAIHARTPENCAWLYAGISMFMRFCTEKYEISKKDRHKILDQFDKALNRSLRIQRREMTHINESKLFISTMKKMLATNQVNFAEIRKGKNNKNKATSDSKTVGFIKDKYVYLLADNAYSKTSAYLQSADGGYSLPQKELFAKLDREGLIIRTEKNRVKSKLTVNSTRIETLKFKKSVFFEK